MTAEEPRLDRARRIAGGLYGLLLGLVYALTAGTIDWFILRDVPLRVDWPRVFGSVALTGLAGFGLGVLTAWPGSFVKGVIYGALGISVGGTLLSLVTSGGSFQLSAALFVTFLPRAVLSAPIAVVLRSLTSAHEEAGPPRPGEVSPRYWLPLATILVGLVFGSLAQMPPEAKAALRQTDRIVQNGLNAQAPEEMPSALLRVDDFQAKASPYYRLDQRLVPFSIQQLTEVRVHFDNGFVVSCLYAADATPTCDEVEG